jgi:hypothetical protein
MFNRLCYALDLKDRPAAEYSEERQRNHDFFNAYFGPRKRYNILCDECGSPLVFSGVVDYTSYPPAYQAICSKMGCRKPHLVTC